MAKNIGKIRLAKVGGTAVGGTADEEIEINRISGSSEAIFKLFILCFFVRFCNYEF